jgi:hypothetical protein
MKRIIVSIAMLTIAFSATAQSDKSSDSPIKFNAGVEVGLPIGDFSDISSIGIGTSAQGEYAASEKLGITLNVGYLTFSGKSVDLGILGSVKLPSTSIVPILAGVKIYFSEKVYGHAQAGISIFNNDLGTAFTYAPSIGVMATEKIDISLKYQAAAIDGATLSFLGLRAAYTF